MRVAILSEIQGNLAALEAVLASVDELDPSPQRIISAGDVVGRGPHPNEVISLLREREIESVKGNYDDAVANARMGSGADFALARDAETDQLALTWTREILTAENLEFLQILPHDIRLSPSPGGVKVVKNEEDQRVAEYRRSFFMRALFGGFARTPPRVGRRTLVLHGSPRALNEFVREDTANSMLQAIAKDAHADVVISGHSGTCFQKSEGLMIFIGVGSVGNPRGVPGLAEYAVIDWGTEVLTIPVQVPYDAGLHLSAMRTCGLPPSLSPSD
jgi:predicted phosphodiesterase